MNHGYHVQGALEDTKLIERDTNADIQCKNPTNSYWGGNSPLNLAFNDGSLTLKAHWYEDFSQPVYDPAGGKRATGASSPFDCLRTDLILEPYAYSVPIL